jgi:hypothetical protein
MKRQTVKLLNLAPATKTCIVRIHVTLLNREQMDNYSFVLFTSFGTFMKCGDKEKIHNETTVRILKIHVERSMHERSS